MKEPTKKDVAEAIAAFWGECMAGDWDYWKDTECGFADKNLPGLAWEDGRTVKIGDFVVVVTKPRTP